MEGGGRPHQGRGSGGRRGGGGGGSDSGSSVEHRGGRGRGRGRGSHPRGKTKREHYRGRGRGILAADFSRGKDVSENTADFEDEGPSIFTKRKLESNWDRYEASEKVEQNEDAPMQRGTDYHALLCSAGDSFTQFRFSEEKDWEMDSLAAHQMSGVFVDLAVLAQSLQELPLHQRLNLEPELVQEATPVELPTITMVGKPDSSALGGGGFKTAAPATKGLVCGTGVSSPAKPTPALPKAQASSSELKAETEEVDEELDLLLGLQKPIAELSPMEMPPSTERPPMETPPSTAEEVTPAPSEKAGEEKKIDEVAEGLKEEETPPEPAPVKQEVSEEDLEDWLDSMIS